MIIQILLLIIIAAILGVCFFLIRRQKFLNTSFNVEAALAEFKSDLRDSLNIKLDQNKDLVTGKLHENFISNQETINTKLGMVTNQVIKVQESQKNMLQAQNQLVDLQRILGNQKQRGIFGEARLQHLLSLVYGNDKNIYEVEFKLEESKTCDAAIFLHDKTIIPIDSKFPLENYQKSFKENISAENKLFYQRAFRQDLKKRVQETAKYIIPGKTIDYAIMFVPAESIFCEILQEHPIILNDAFNKKVVLASPTTLLAMLKNILLTINIANRNENTLMIEKQLNELGVEFNRFSERWNELSTKIDQIVTKKEMFSKTTNKLTNKFNKISKK